jgi:hypothetical protein
MSKLALVLIGSFFALAGAVLFALGHMRNKSWKAFLGGILGGLGLVLTISTPLPEGHVFQVQNGHPVPWVA